MENNYKLLTEIDKQYGKLYFIFINDKNIYAVKINRKIPLKQSNNGIETNENILSANFDNFHFRVSINSDLWSIGIILI